MKNMEFTGLALEYQGNYGSAHRNLNFADLVDDAATQSKIRIFGLSFKEETFNSRFVDSCTSFDNHQTLLSVNGQRFGVCHHNRGSKQIKACYVKEFLDKMEDLGIHEE
jgi:hypothetical protein